MAQEKLILTESQLAALERAKEEKEAHGEIETEHPGYLGAQDTYYVGNIKGVGHIYQQTFIDTYSKVAFCKLYDRKNALVAADMLNDMVVPFFDTHGIPLLRILTDRLKILNTPGLKRSRPKRTVFANGLIKSVKTNFIQLRFGKRFIGA